MPDQTVLLVQFTEPVRVIAMIAVVLVTAGLGLWRIPAIIAASVLTTLSADIMARGDDWTAGRVVTGFLAGLVIAGIVWLIRTYVIKPKAG